MKGVTTNEVAQLVPMMKPYTVAFHPFCTASLGKKGGKRQTARDEVSVAVISTHRIIFCRVVILAFSAGLCGPSPPSPEHTSEELSSSLTAAMLDVGVGGGARGGSVDELLSL